VKYADYLRTAAWQAKRDKVLARAQRVCEGCRDREATEVHHLTYAHVGRELLFELVALCEACHAVVHDTDVPREIPELPIAAKFKPSVERAAEARKKLVPDWW
jgi:5-methylcytosine-specific restriction endonuclease McrA